MNDDDFEQVATHQNAALMLTDEVDITRSDVISTCDATAQIADQLEAAAVWMHDQPMLSGQNYLMTIGTTTVIATELSLEHKGNINTLKHVAGEKLDLNDIGEVEPEPDRPSPLKHINADATLGRHFDRPGYRQNRQSRNAEFPSPAGGQYLFTGSGCD